MIKFSLPNTLGVELEFSNVEHNQIRDKFDALKQTYQLHNLWLIKYDNSVVTSKEEMGKTCLYGGELVSPILCGDRTLDELQTVMLFMQENNVKSNETCSAHLHIGAHILKNDLALYKAALIRWIANENMIYNLFNPNKSLDHMNFSKPVYLHLYDKIDDILNFDGTIEEFIDMFLPNREICLNLRNIVNSPHKKTVEVRMLMPTSDLNYWNNVLSFFPNFFQYFITDVMGIEEDIQKIKSMNEKYLYKDVKSFLESSDDCHAFYNQVINSNQNSMELESVKKSF